MNSDGDVCALGAVGKARNMEMNYIDIYCREEVAIAFAIAPSMAAEIMFMNDEDHCYYNNETPAQRFDRVCNWVKSQMVP